jgi:hypothetical protein
MSSTDNMGRRLKSHPADHLTHSLARPRAAVMEQVGGYVVVGADDRGKPEGPRESRLSRPPLGSPGHRSSTVFGRDAAAPASYPSPIMTA